MKKDTSPKVPQRDKVKQSLDIKKFDWTEKQKSFIELAQNKKTNIIFVTGPAGSAKTFLASYVALNMVNEHKVSDIVYVRSAVESADSKLGYLPGEVDEKMSYYGIPLADKLEELLPRSQKEALIKDGRVTVMPVNYVRGQNWNARVVIVDEAQNMTQKELYTVLTRLGKFSKCFVLADPSQSDINGKSGGFEKLRDHYCSEAGGDHGIYSFLLDTADIMRSDLVKFLVENYPKK